MCGHQSRENRPKKPDGDGFIMDKFLCQECGYKDDADLNAARVIAMKRAWREGLPQSQRPKLMVNLSEKYQFKTYIKDRAEMRDSGL
jgi:transposase